ncbi:MAG TPA: FtsW/RodA/SpoVE family cell cycle protein [Candidatus Paceibacterota bacterium]
MRKGFDRTFLLFTLLLLVVGFFVFTSAALGLLARSDGAHFARIAFNQAFLGIGLGIVGLFVAANLNYRHLRKFAFVIFILALISTALVFVPGIGLSSGGATRWIQLGPLSWQPAEFLKLATIIYLAAWLSGLRDKVKQFRYSIVPFAVIITLCGILLILQPDTGTFMVIVAASLAILVAAGVRLRHILLLVLIAILGIGVLAYSRPYVKDRLLTFIDPTSDPRGASYQLQQSLIAVGSGGFGGRGFGQSIQKFSYLPEPVGDSIFAVAAEEFGFVGSSILVTLFLLLGLQGLKIATRAPDVFGGLLTVGIVILIVSQSFINIASMVGVLPLTGLPMLFVSHGGTAMLFALTEIGIVLNVSRYRT